MTPEFLRYYEQELAYLREQGGEFAKAYPKVAGRLGLDKFSCADPYVERLLEGFAFLSARINLKLDAAFPTFTHHLLNHVYPLFLSPGPSACVVQFEPTPDAGGEGPFLLPRDTVLRSKLGVSEQTKCEFRTCQDVALQPIRLAKVNVVTQPGNLNIDSLPPCRSVIKLTFETLGGADLKQLKLDKLPIYLRGSDQRAHQLYEWLSVNASHVLLRDASGRHHELLSASAGIRPMGFHDDEALLKADPREFSGYRLLREFLLFQEKFLFVEFQQLAAVNSFTGKQFELLILLDKRADIAGLSLSPDQFALFCSPAVNLFPKTLDPVVVDSSALDHQLVADRSRPMDFEIFSLEKLTGYEAGGNSYSIKPFLSSTVDGDDAVYYDLERRPRRPSNNQRQRGHRSTYMGSELFARLVDTQQAPYSDNLKQLTARAWCTNRDLPLSMPKGTGKTDFSLVVSAPVGAIRAVSEVSAPVPARRESAQAWDLIRHLSLNYLSLLQQEEGVSYLQEVLKLYAPETAELPKRWSEGVVQLRSHSSIFTVPSNHAPSSLVRGLSLEITMDESRLDGTSAVIFAQVIEEFLTRYVAVNSALQLRLRSSSRGEIAQWPARLGRSKQL